jgi:predicted metal-dependent hydrolase
MTPGGGAGSSVQGSLLDDPALPAYRVVRSKRKTLELRLHADQSLEVRAPWRIRDADIRAFVASRRDWIERRLQTMPAPAPAPGLVDGAQHLFLGERLPLRIRTARRNSVHFRDDAIEIRMPEPHSEERVGRALEDGYRRQARSRFAGWIDLHFPAFRARGHDRPRLRVKKMKTRWGSLSTRGYINLNLALMKVSPACAEYVVVHELCHLEEANHGPGFQRLMDLHLPDWRARRDELNQAPLQ